MFNQSRVKIMTLPAKIDRSENQNNLVAKFYDEYAAFNYDEYQLDVKILQLEYEIKKESESMYDVQAEYDRVVPLKQALIDQIKLAIEEHYGL